jgi:hypothetical protein
MVNKLLKILLLFSPIAYGVGIPLEKFDLIFFYLAVLSLFISSLWDKPRREFGVWNRIS